MPDINRTAIVPYSCVQMYQLVNDIATYPDFLPWCRSSQILSQTTDEVRATLELAGAGIHKSFSTINRLQPYKMIEVRLLNGPFKHLEGFWQFELLNQTSCKIIFNLEFEFSGRLMSMLLEPVFHPIANSLVDSFCTRAEVVYGPAVE